MTNFRKLTPQKDVKEEIYEEAFDYALKDADIKNVGITSQYGAGKSTIVQSYLERHKEKNVVYISLPCFNEVQAKTVELNDNVELDDDTLSNIEQKLLNQIITQIDSRKIPRTNFTHKIVLPKWKLNLDLIAIGVFIIGTFILLLSTNERIWSCLQSIMKEDKITLLLIISALFVAASVTFALFQVFKWQYNLGFIRKISIKNSTIDLSDSKKKTFDQYINELSYVLNTAQIDIVCFEDVDRFNNVLIFEKLREINFIINHDKANKKKIMFFYLIKDQLFEARNRTKFFDFIIPIVPFIGSSNSFEKMKELFMEEKISNHFISLSSVYVDDMRLLNNIYNEYMVYKNRINITLEKTEEKERLLAIVMYKNLFPQDFAKLEKREGYLYNEIKMDSENATASQNIGKTEIQRQFVEFLKKEKLVDEMYEDYINIFYPGRLSENDNRYLMSVSADDEPQYLTPLLQIENIVNRLDSKSLAKRSTLNASLLEFLIFRKKDEEKLNNIYECILRHQEIEFVIAAMNNLKGGALQKFFKDINARWTELAAMVNQKYDNGEKEKELFFYYLFKYVDIEILEVINQSDLLHDFIDENVSDVNFFVGIAPYKICNLMEKFEIVLNSLGEKNEENQNIYEEIYKQNLYKITESNLNSILNSQYGVKTADNSIDYLKEIRKKKNEPIYGYIMENLDLYAVASIKAKWIFDMSEAYAYDVLNSSQVDISDKKALVAAGMGELCDILNIEEAGLISELYQRKKLKLNALNYIFGIEENVVQNIISQEEAANYLNDLDDNKIEPAPLDDWNEDKIRDIQLFFIQLENVNEGVLTNILSQLKCYIDDFNLVNLSVQRVHFLIEHKYISLSVENLKFIRLQYNTVLKEYIFKNIADYIICLENFPELCDDGELVTILGCDITKREKRKIIKLISGGISIIGFDIKTEKSLISMILKEHFDTDDFDYLVGNYNAFDDENKKLIISNIVENIQEFIDYNIDCGQDVLEKVLNSEISILSKILVFRHSIDKDYQKIVSALKILRLNQIADRVQNGGTQKIELTNLDQNVFSEILKAMDSLKENGHLGKYKVLNEKSFIIYGLKNGSRYKPRRETQRTNAMIRKKKG